MSEPIKLVFRPQARALKNEVQATGGSITLQTQSPVTLGFVNDGFERYVDVVRALRGERGNDGRDGRDGKDGYTPIKGVDYFDGVAGRDGVDGTNGTPGADGKSAYQIAVDAGFIGTEQEWLETLKSAVVPAPIGSLTFLPYTIYYNQSFWPEGYVALSQDLNNPTRVLAIEYPHLEPYFPKETVYQGAGFTGGLDMVNKVADGTYTVTQSSAWNNSPVNGYWGAANVFDGQITDDTVRDAWCADGDYIEQWIGVQFDVSKPITSVVYVMPHYSGGAGIVTLQYYNGATWVDVGGPNYLDNNLKAVNQIDYGQNTIAATKWRFNFGFGIGQRMGEIYIGTPDSPLVYDPGQAIDYYNLGSSYLMGYYPFVFIGGKDAVPV